MYIAKIALLLLATSVAFSAENRPVRIDVFVTQSTMPIGAVGLKTSEPGAVVRVHEIDGIEKFEVQLSEGLPADVGTAERTALKRLRKLEKSDREILQDVADSLVLAWQLQLRRYPAVVVNRRWVVYGVTDLNTAYALYEERRGEDGS